jgi:hypothetical protein
MSRTKAITIYTFDELSDAAKERARQWWREGHDQAEWWDAVYEEAARMADMLGIDLKQKPVKLMNGSTRYDPAIYFSGFSSQGDGACFEGTYRYQKGSVKAITTEAPTDERLQGIARGLADLQRAHGYTITARVDQRGHYSHEYSTEIQVWQGRNEEPADTETDKAITEALREFMRWIYRQLEAEYEYQTSDEQVDDNIRANEYEFDGDGGIA